MKNLEMLIGLVNLYNERNGTTFNVVFGNSVDSVWIDSEDSKCYLVTYCSISDAIIEMRKKTIDEIHITDLRITREGNLYSAKIDGIKVDHIDGLTLIKLFAEYGGI